MKLRQIRTRRNLREIVQKREARVRARDEHAQRGGFDE